MGQERFVRACRIRRPGGRVGVSPGVWSTVTWQEQRSPSHRPPATALLRSCRDDSTKIARAISTQALSEWIPAHPLWGEWPDGGRVRTLAPVDEKR